MHKQRKSLVLPDSFVPVYTCLAAHITIKIPDPAWHVFPPEIHADFNQSLQVKF